MKSVNKHVACTPFESTELKVEARGGLPIIKQRHELAKLVIVYDTDDGAYLAGDTVYVLSDTSRHPQGKQVYEVEAGKPFILLPYEFVRAFERPQRARLEPTRIPGGGVPITP